MAEIQLLIKNQLGLHARACALFVKASSRFKSEITVSRDDLVVNGKSIMGVMMLAAEEGVSDRVTDPVAYARLRSRLAEGSLIITLPARRGAF